VPQWRARGSSLTTELCPEVYRTRYDAKVEYSEFEIQGSLSLPNSSRRDGGGPLGAGAWGRYIPRARRHTSSGASLLGNVLQRPEISDHQARLRLAIGAGRMAVWELDVITEALSPSPELNRLHGFPDDATPTIDEFRSRYAPGERERIQREGAEAMPAARHCFSSRSATSGRTGS